MNRLEELTRQVLEGGRLGREEAAAALRGMGLEPESLEPLPAGRHIFTHVEWQMAAWRGQVAGEGAPDLTWAAPEELEKEYAIPSAFRQPGWWEKTALNNNH